MRDVSIYFTEADRRANDGEYKVPPNAESRSTHRPANASKPVGNVNGKRSAKDKTVSKGQIRDAKAGKQPDASLKPRRVDKGAKPQEKKVSKSGKSRACYNCGDYGHLGADCPVGMICRVCKSNTHITADHGKDAVVIETPPAIIDNQPSQAQALLAELDEANGVMDDGDDARVVLEEEQLTPEQIAAAELATKLALEAAKLEDKRVDIIKHIRAKMQSLLLHKNLTCAKDRAIVLRSAASIATRDEAHKIPNFDVSRIVTEIYAEEIRNVFASRQAMARSIAVETQTGFTIFKNALDNNNNDLTISQVVTGDPLVVSGSPIARLSYLESLETFGRPKIDALCRNFWFLGKITRHMVLPALEEAGKRVVNAAGHSMFISATETTGLPGLLRGFSLWMLSTWAKLSGDMHVNSAIGLLVLQSVRRLAYAPGITTMSSFLKLVNPGALLLSLYETRNNPSKLPMRWRLLHLAMRHIGHSLLSTTTLKYGIVGHIAWNSISDLFEAKCALRISEHFKSNHVMQTPQAIVDKHEADLYRVDGMSHAAVCLDEHYLKKHPVNPDFRVTPGDATCENKFGTRCSFGIESAIATVYNSCHHNETISMNGRVGKLLPAHASAEVRGKIKKHWDNVTNELIEHFNKRIKRVVKPIPVQDWINGFPPSKREMFNGLVENQAELPSRLVASSFVKKEIVVKMNDSMTFKDPRFIQGCPPELSLVCGPHLRKFAKNLRHGLAPRVEYANNEGVEESKYRADDVKAGGHIIYTCGMSNQEIGESYSRAIRALSDMCDDDEKVVFLEDDQSRFDLHMGEGAFRFLDRLYRKKLVKKVSSAISRVRRDGNNSGRSNLGTNYNIKYTMQSGWPDTSVGDTAVNAAMKLSIHGIGHKWVSIICGDDSVTVTTDKEIASIGGIDGILQQYADFGMEVEAKLSDDSTVVEFCSGRFLKHGNGFYLVPKVGKLLSKLCWDMVERSPAQSRAWLRSITNTLLMFGQVDPLLNALGVNFRQQLGVGPVLQEAYNEFKHVLRGDVASSSELDICEYYDTHYSMNAGDIDACVAHLSSVRIGTLSRCPFLEHLARVDC